ncbi:MAG: hypothetical protein LBH19_03990 [Dysgonamonadaceae bacterium]|jgi:hypothetical protein|nr:hypothetical protein [Dysgonamonadaceae bacterium]
MNFGKRLNDLQSEIINALCAIEEFPEGLLPHCVYVEEESEKSLECGNSVYTAYYLTRIFSDGSCMLENPETGTEEKRDLREINIEWLITVWDYCCDLSGRKETLQKVKKLYVFVYPANDFERNMNDEELLSAWERDEVEKYTPDEFAELANDEMFDERGNWIRFIEVEE